MQQLPMMRTMRLQPNNLKISIMNNSSALKMLESQESAENLGTDLDFFQTCPLGSSGFELDCWEKKVSNVTQGTEPISTRWGSSSFEDQDDGFEWGETDNSSVYSVEEQDSSSISASDEEDDAENDGDDGDIPTRTMSQGNSACHPSDLQQVSPCEEIHISISQSVQALEPFFQAAIERIGAKHVHFGATVVTAEYTYEKPSDDDFFRLYYSAHELQRLQDQYRIDVASTKSHSRPERKTTGVFQKQVDDSGEKVKQVDCCKDYPVW